MGLEIDLNSNFLSKLGGGKQLKREKLEKGFNFADAVKSLNKGEGNSNDKVSPQKAEPKKGTASADGKKDDFQYRWDYDKIQKQYKVSNEKIKYLKLQEKVEAGAASEKEVKEYNKMREKIAKKIEKFKTTVKASNGLTYQKAQEIIQEIKNKHSGIYKGTDLWPGEKEALDRAHEAIHELGLKYGFIVETKLGNGQILKDEIPESQWDALFIDAKV